ncbi:MAG: adenine phosphoribosyltransferase [Candidatus Woesearchaeota archaeon]
MKDYKQFIEAHRDFPKKGVVFRDFTPLIKNPEAFRDAINDIKKHFNGKDINKIAAIESKGFIIGSALAYEMGLPLVLIRKPSLTPGEVISEKFIKEYGEGEYQVKNGTFTSQDNVLIVYDIMAGPGATRAVIHLVEKQKAKVVGCAYVIELEYLHGREQLKGYDLFSLVKFGDKYEV